MKPYNMLRSNGKLPLEVSTRNRMVDMALNFIEGLSDEDILQLLEHNPTVPTLRFVSVAGKGLMFIHRNEPLPQDLYDLRQQYYESDIKELKSKVVRDQERGFKPVKLGRPRKKKEL